MIKDIKVKRTLNVTYYKSEADIHEKGKLIRTVTPEHADTIVRLMERDTNFFIVDSSPTRCERKENR